MAFDFYVRRTSGGVKGFFMAGSCLASHDSPGKMTNLFYRLDLARQYKKQAIRRAEAP
jgi:hypothetical protein